MLFDSVQPIKEENISIVQEDNIEYFHKLNNSIMNFNESFYNISKEILLKEIYSKTSKYPQLIMSETLEDFYYKVNGNFKNVLNDLDKAVNSFKYKVNLVSKDDATLIDKYRDKFLEVGNIKAKMNLYTLDEIENDYSIIDKVLNDYELEFKKLKLNSIKEVKRSKDYFNVIRGKIIRTNLKLTDSELKHYVYKKIRNNTDKPKVITLDDRTKLRMLQDIVKTNYEIAKIEKDKDNIVKYVNLNMVNIKNQLLYISKNKNDLDNLQIDNLSTSIYNEVDELREILKIYITVLSLKMDAIRTRREEYLSIFEKVVNCKFNELEDTKFDSSIQEDTFLINEHELNEDIFKLECDNLTLFAMENVLDFSSESVELYSEGIGEGFKKILAKIKEGIEKIRIKIVNHKPVFLDKYNDTKIGDTLKAIVDETDDPKVEEAMGIFEIQVDRILKVGGLIKDISIVAKDPTLYDKEEDFYKLVFPDIFNSHKSDEDWKDTIRRYFQGNFISDADKAIDRMLILTNSKLNSEVIAATEKAENKILNFVNYVANYETKASQEKKKIEKDQELTKKVNQSINKQQNVNASYEFDLLREDENSNDANATSAQKSDDALSNIQKASDNGDYNGKNIDSNSPASNSINVGVEKYDKNCQILRKYVSRCQKVIGLSFSVFVDGQNAANKRINTLRRLQNEMNQPSKEQKQEKEQEKKQEEIDKKTEEIAKKK